MNKSESIAQLSAALAKAQGAIKGALKDADNPFFRSHYADLQSVWDAIREPLSANGLAVMQLPGTDPEGITVETILSHESGEWVSSILAMAPVKNDPQGIGSAITYARRYALQSVTGVAPMDDDAEGAMGRGAIGGDAITKREHKREDAARNVARQQSASVERSSPGEPSGDWRSVVCSFGKKDGPMRGKKLGDLNDGSLKYLAELFLDGDKKIDAKDQPMVDALRAWRDEKSGVKKPAPGAGNARPNLDKLDEVLAWKAQPEISKEVFMKAARQLLPDRIPANAKFDNMSEETAKIFLDDFENVSATCHELMKQEAAK